MIFRPTSGLDKGAGKAFWQRADQSQNVAHNKLLQLICFGFLAITAAFYSVAALAQSTLGGLLGEADSEILSPDVAFVLEALPHGDNQLVATFTIVEGHYLYRDKITFNVADDEDVNLDVVSLTEGVNKYDEFFGDVGSRHNDRRGVPGLCRSGYLLSPTNQTSKFHTRCRVAWRGRI